MGLAVKRTDFDFSLHVGQARVRARANRLSISTGQPCESCGADTWFCYQGHNRCGCGRFLWIERREQNGTRFRYVQGPALPKDYRGWLRVTA